MAAQDVAQRQRCVRSWQRPADAARRRLDLSEYGYVEEEFFVEGTANRYDTPSGETGSVVSSGHPYRTRIVVRRPTSALRSNGIVLFEWQNVSAGYELDAHWGPSWRHFVRRGYTWVGVSAQRVGVHGFGIPGLDRGLKDWSPVRHGSLDLTDGGTMLDDSLCYDVFAQSAQAALNPTGIDPLGGLPVNQAFAVGASQSAGRLTAYHDSIHPLHQLCDGFYLLVGGGPLRTDLDVKVLRYLSENDVERAGPDVRQDDSDVLVTHEVAGTGHSSYVSNVYREPITIRDFGGIPFPGDCDQPPFKPRAGLSRDQPQLRPAHRLGRLRREAARLAAVGAPIALNSGQNSSASVFCSLYGTHQPFDAATLQALYPSHGDYLGQVVGTVFENLFDGYIPFANALETLVEAAQSEIPPQ